MHRRRQAAFGMAERGQQPLDPPERQVDQQRVQLGEPFEDGVATQPKPRRAG
jgi:hypothetical protein